MDYCNRQQKEEEEEVEQAYPELVKPKGWCKRRWQRFTQSRLGIAVVGLKKDADYAGQSMPLSHCRINRQCLMCDADAADEDQLCRAAKSPGRAHGLIAKPCSQAVRS